MPRVVIVGGGISGLATAYRLQQRHPALEVVVLERQARPGGTIGTCSRGGFRVEAGPNGFLDNNPSTLALCSDLGLAGRLVPGRAAAARGQPPPRGSTMWSFREGLGLLVETLRDRLRQPPVLGVAARRVLRRDSGAEGPAWEVRGEGREHWTADAVVLACPAYEQAA